MECIVCDGDTELEDVEEDKLRRLKEADSSLEEHDIKKVVCKDCGHTAYIKN